MQVERTQNEFALTKLTQSELELLQMGLIHLKCQSLKGEVFAPERQSCDEMFLRIDLELIASKTHLKPEPCQQQ